MALGFNALEQAVVQQISSSAQERSFSYQMARLNYDYKGKYLITGTLRRDGFSGFAENNKTALFPSVALGWTISEEDFLSDTAITYLKLRGSYGVNGNLTNPYSSLARIVVPEGGISSYLFGDGGTTVNVQDIQSLSNPDLTWETTNGINVGLDFGLWDNKITGNIDYYSSTTKDLLWNFVLPEVTGFSSILTNSGEIKNDGLEIFINTTPVQTANFSWDFGLNFATNGNEIVSLIGLDQDGDGSEDDLIANGLFIGQPINTIYNYQVNGLWQVGEDLPDGFIPGTHKLEDLNNDGAITPEDDRRILGNGNIAYSIGIQKDTVRYKDFALNFFINSEQGGSNGYLQANDPWTGGALE